MDTDPIPLQRTYTRVILTTDALAELAEILAALPGRVAMSADATSFAALDDLVDELLEDMAVDDVELVAGDGAAGRIRVHYRPNGVSLEASLGPSGNGPVEAAFHDCAAVLGSCRPSPTPLCDIAPSPEPHSDVDDVGTANASAGPARSLLQRFRDVFTHSHDAPAQRPLAARREGP